MQFAATLVAADPATLMLAQTRAVQALASAGARIGAPQQLGPSALDLMMDAEEATLPRLRQAAREATERLSVDTCVQPAEGRKKKLLISDMDSTIVSVECIDELADYMGIKPQIAAITERGMKGEIDFETGVRERVAMLAGLPCADVDRCIAERVKLNPGARALIATMKAGGADALLVSGGFTLFVEHVANELGFDGFQSNTLELADGRLTGKVVGPIFGSAQKLVTLKEEAAKRGLDLSQTLAVGDGANDLAMIEAAGLGIAYHAQPIVAAKAAACVVHGDLTALLYFQGYRAEELAA